MNWQLFQGVTLCSQEEQEEAGIENGWMDIEVNDPISWWSKT